MYRMFLDWDFTKTKNELSYTLSYYQNYSKSLASTRACVSVF